jgi:hypothetical protein
MIQTLRSYQEQCLKNLIEIAKNNGYNFTLNIDNNSSDLLSILLFDWKSNDKSFIQCLLKALVFTIENNDINFKTYKLISNVGKEISIRTPSDLTSDIIRSYLVNKPNSERLNLFLDFFSILLH